MRIQDLIEKARQKALAPRGSTQCRVCQCGILPEKRRGPPRLICETCALFQVAASHPLPRHCEQCKAEFWPERNVARFCSNECRQQSNKIRRRLVYKEQRCCGCEKAIDGRARKFCSPDCRQQLRIALRRKFEAPSVQACPECEKVFTSRRAGVMFCSRTCAKRRADRNYCERRRDSRHGAAKWPSPPEAQGYDDSVM
jgi:hypothetical protein